MCANRRVITPARLRFFTPALEWTAFQAHPFISYWCFRGWRYLRAIVDAGVEVCALQSIPQAGVDLGNELSPWFELRECFGRPVAENYVNVVCGGNGDVHRLFTVGVINIAITGVYSGAGYHAPKADEIASLKRYDAVYCPTARDAIQLKSDAGIHALWIDPAKPATIGPLLRRYVHD